MIKSSNVEYLYVAKVCEPQWLFSYLKEEIRLDGITLRRGSFLSAQVVEACCRSN